MASIKHSVCLPMMKPAAADLGGFLREVKRIGYQGVEIWGRDGTFGALMEEVKSAGLRLAQMCGHGTLAEGLNNPANHDRIEAELRESIDLAAAHDIPGLICFSGNRRAGVNDFEGLTHCVAGLRRMAKYAEQKGVNLNVELLNSRIDHPGYQADQTAWGVALCRMVDSPRVKLLFDIYHVQIMEGDIIRRIREAIGHIGHFHTAGVPAREDLDDRQELNYRGIFSAIAQSGYELYVGHEYRPRGEVMESLRQTFALGV